MGALKIVHPEPVAPVRSCPPVPVSSETELVALANAIQKGGNMVRSEEPRCRPVAQFYLRVILLTLVPMVVSLVALSCQIGGHPASVALFFASCFSYLVFGWLIVREVRRQGEASGNSR